MIYDFILFLSLALIAKMIVTFKLAKKWMENGEADLKNANVDLLRFGHWMAKHDWKRPRNYKSMDNRYDTQNLEPFEDNWELIFEQLSQNPEA